MESLLQQHQHDIIDNRFWASSQFTPIHIATQKNHHGICWQLVVHQYYNNSNDQIQSSSSSESSKHLLIDEVDQWGNTPLHTAAANGHVKLLKWLLDIGSNFSTKNMYDQSPIDVASTKVCRQILKAHCNNGIYQLSAVEEETLPLEKRFEQMEVMIKAYNDLQAKLRSLVASSLEDLAISFDLNNIQNLIDKARDFGLTHDVIDQSLQRLEWLKVRKNILVHIESIKENSPIITPTSFVFVNNLRNLIHNILDDDKKEKHDDIGIAERVEGDDNQHALDSEIEHLIKASLELYDKCTSEFNLNKVTEECHKIPCANKARHSTIIDVLQKAIVTAKMRNVDSKLIENGERIDSRFMSEINFQAVLDTVPNPKLPVPGMTNKQAKKYWQEEDIGHIKETEGFPLPPPDKEDYIWIKSESFQSLETSLSELKKCISDAEAFDANLDLLESGKKTLKQKQCIDLKQLLDKDEVDRLAALTIVKKAAKKLIKKKKGLGKNKA